MKSTHLGMIFLAAALEISVASSKEDISENAEPVSMVNILVFPEKYVEKKVQVGGYVMFYDGWRIFLTCEHAHQIDRESSVAITRKSQKYKNSMSMKGWAYITGTLRVAENGNYFIESEGNFMFQYGRDKDWFYGKKDGEIPKMPEKNEKLPPLPTCHE